MFLVNPDLIADIDNYAEEKLGIFLLNEYKKRGSNSFSLNCKSAAESLGIGSCYIGDIMENCEEQRALLHLPPYIFPAAMLVFGYPSEQQKGRAKPRRADMEHIVHPNAYREMDADELRALFSIRAGNKSYEDYMNAFCARKYNSDFSIEMSRSVGEYLKQFE